MMNVTVDIITLAFNQVNFTKQYLDCMTKLTPRRFEITVVNNGSTDSTADVLNQYSSVMNGDSAPKLFVETIDTNLGFAKGNNVAYGKRKGDIVIFLNNDIRTMNANWAKPLLQAIFAQPLDYKMLVGPTGGYVDRATCDFKYETKNSRDKINYLSGWCLAGRRETFEMLRQNTPGNPEGPFIELFNTYFEDTYMGFLATKLGIPMKIIPCPDIVHFGRVSSRQLNLPKLYSSAREKFKQEIQRL